jgi:TonB-linked SusC/RagA family outer membrane protein
LPARRFLTVGLLAVLALGLAAALPGSARAQFTVEGTVTEAQTDDPIPGANVVVVGTSVGVATGSDGTYEIRVPGSSGVLEFSFVGFESVTREVTPETGTLDVALAPDVAGLEEVVVTGLATSVKRRNLASAVTKIDAEEIAGTVNPGTVDNALQGKLPGVTITSQSGAPGGGNNVQLRGISTLGAGSSQPLYIIDGVYVNNSQISIGRSELDDAGGPSQDNVANRLADLNPQDIASVEVLKGPSAAAIYGQRANAGVIIIETKRGETGRTEVSFSQDVGAVTALNLLGTASWSEDKIARFEERGTESFEREVDRLNQGNRFDYEDEVYGNTGLTTNTQLSVSGGTEDTRFYVAGTLKEEDGIVENTGFGRRSIRANVDHRITDRIQIASQSNYLYTDNDRGFTGNQNSTGGSVGYTLAFVRSYADLFERADGTFPDNPYFAENPLRITDAAVNNQEISRFIQSFSTEIDLLETDATSLRLTGQGGFDYLSSTSTVYFPPFFQFQQAQPNPGDVIEGDQNDFNTNAQAFLVFDRSLDTGTGPLGLTSQVGFTRFTRDTDRRLVRGRGLPPRQTNPLNASVQELVNQLTGAPANIVFNTVKVRDIGWVAQQEANWADRLIGTVGVRMDRSTLNADQDEYYFFPKASLALNLHEFDFWGLPEVNQLKLRGAFGQTGGLPQYGVTFESLVGENIDGSLGTNIATRGVDPDLEPERAEEFEFGIDAGAFDNRVGLELTYYRKTISDLILDQENPVSTGITTIAVNAGTLRNTGWEVGLTLSPLRSERFNWLSRTLFWTNDSEITELDIPRFTTGGFGAALGTYLIQEGFSPTTIVGTPATPDADAPFTVYGDAQPDFQMSFSNQFTLFRDFELGFLFHWKQGGENINLTRFLTDSGGTTPDWNEDEDGDGTPNGLDRIDQFGPGAAQFIEEASYVKLREASLYYTVPSSVLENAFGGVLSRVRLGVSGSNLLLFSDYSSYDPEVSVFGTQAVAQSVEVAPFPSSRRFTFHLQLTY